MSPAASAPPADWNARRLRAQKLLARRPQAAPLLEFLIELLELQRDLFAWAGGQDWLPAVAAAEGEFPRLRLARLPLEELSGRFSEFLERAAEIGTDVVRGLAENLTAQGTDSQRLVLAAYLAREPLDTLAKALGCDPLQLEFFPRAFAQPLAEALAAQAAPAAQTAKADGKPPEEWHENFCPVCGGPPQLAVLLDEALIKSRRLLECALCRTRWPFRRGLCPHCGEDKAEQLEIHTTEDLPHLRVEECKTCRGYLKAVDLRKDGLAVPLVDEIASIELDLWADERGLWKLQPNLVGI